MVRYASHTHACISTPNWTECRYTCMVPSSLCVETLGWKWRESKFNYISSGCCCCQRKSCHKRSGGAHSRIQELSCLLLQWVGSSWSKIGGWEAAFCMHYSMCNGQGRIQGGFPKTPSVIQYGQGFSFTYVYVAIAIKSPRSTCGRGYAKLLCRVWITVIR